MKRTIPLIMIAALGITSPAWADDAPAKAHAEHVIVKKIIRKTPDGKTEVLEGDAALAEMAKCDGGNKVEGATKDVAPNADGKSEQQQTRVVICTKTSDPKARLTHLQAARKTVAEDVSIPESAKIKALAAIDEEIAKATAAVAAMN